MSDLTLTADKCPHGIWHPHNALLMEDGSSIPDPDGPCEGGRINVVGTKFWYSISPATAMALKRYEEAVTDG